jgi:hypothetical protein
MDWLELELEDKERQHVKQDHSADGQDDEEAFH